MTDYAWLFYDYYKFDPWIIEERNRVERIQNKVRLMKRKIKITFNISEDVVEMLEQRVPKRKRNVFIEEAIHCRFATMEQELFMRELAAHNRTQNEELDLIGAGLEQAELDDAILQSDDLLNEDEILELDELL